MILLSVITRVPRAGPLCQNKEDKMTSYVNTGRSPVVRVPVGTVRVADPFSVLQRQMSRLFEDFKTPEGAAAATSRLGATDITENASAYVVATEVPGCSENDIKLGTANGLLTISGEKKKPELAEGTKHHVAGRQFAAFEDSFAIPEDVDVDKISATIKNGVLTVTMPKKAEAKPAERQIAIKAG
ncbi:Hsp20/alpha crystallin family protein [Acetobacter pasteurianus]|uniref:Hsp20/alpha crystallin family protein n=1 Tax=Acetobacter pasteurianus TaxID=438 RepID=UPI003D1409E5